MFEAALPEIEEALAFVCRRQRCRVDEAEEFASYAHLKLIEDDCAVLRRFKGQAEFKTFLVAVIHRRFIDFRRERWGTWRPSAEARRLGPMAVKLDRMLTRDGFSLDEAIETMATNGCEASREDLRCIAERLPRRARRRMEGEEALADLAIPPSEVEASLMGEERGRRVGEVRRAIESVVARLPDEDAIILRLRFDDGLTVGRIAKLLGLPEKPLYRRIERLLAVLREELMAGGVTAQDVAELLEAGAFGES